MAPTLERWSALQAGSGGKTPGGRAVRPATVPGMTVVRRAVPDDAQEVLRLRQVMIDSMARSDPSRAWHAEALPVLRARLAEPDGPFAAFVVDHPRRPGALAPLVAGSLESRISWPRN